MNYTFDGIMARLQKGETIETIGNEFAEMLNLADTAHRAEILKNEKAKVEAANKEARMCILSDIVGLLADYARYANMDLTEDDLAIDLEDFDKTIMSMLEMTKTLAELKELSFPKQPVQKAEIKKAPAGTMSADEALRKFIATLG